MTNALVLSQLLLMAGRFSPRLSLMSVAPRVMELKGKVPCERSALPDCFPNGKWTEKLRDICDKFEVVYTCKLYIL